VSSDVLSQAVPRAQRAVTAVAAPLAMRGWLAINFYRNDPGKIKRKLVCASLLLWFSSHISSSGLDIPLRAE
jgi:hypothetical protein